MKRLTKSSPARRRAAAVRIPTETRMRVFVPVWFASRSTIRPTRRGATAPQAVARTTIASPRR